MLSPINKPTQITNKKTTINYINQTIPMSTIDHSDTINHLKKMPTTYKIISITATNLSNQIISPIKKMRNTISYINRTPTNKIHYLNRTNMVNLINFRPATTRSINSRQISPINSKLTTTSSINKKRITNKAMVRRN